MKRVVIPVLLALLLGSASWGQAASQVLPCVGMPGGFELGTHFTEAFSKFSAKQGDVPFVVSQDGMTVELPSLGIWLVLSRHVKERDARISQMFTTNPKLPLLVPSGGREGIKVGDPESLVAKLFGQYRDRVSSGGGWQVLLLFKGVMFEIGDQSRVVETIFIIPCVPGLAYLGFNLADPLTKDVRVRRAVSYAIDRQKFAAASGDRPAPGVHPPGTAGYNPSLKLPPFSPARAKELLLNAGHERGTTLTVWVAEQELRAERWGRALFVMRDGLRAAGIETRFETYGVESTLLANLTLGIRKPGLIHAFSRLLQADSSGAAFSKMLFLSGSQENVVGYRNPEIERLLDLAATERDLTRRTSLYQQVEQRALQDAPVVPLVFDMP